MPGQQRLRVEIQGAVQGVGFRPYVYRLATELALNGWVINDTRGVFVEVEGERQALEDFLRRLPAGAPPRALIQDLRSDWLSPAGYSAFEIRHSDDQGQKTVLVLPDIATCPECLADTVDPANRRYRYAFTNCTNCGPRFSIIRGLPYDRPNTTMERFKLCPACRAEYENPLDRRFHAQPNACPECGPELAFYTRRLGTGPGTTTEKLQGPQCSQAPYSPCDHPGYTQAAKGRTGRWPGEVGAWGLAATGGAALAEAAARLRGGDIVAVKGLGGFLLMADAANSSALRRLRAGKPRRDKPFALMARDLEQVRQFCEVPEAATGLLAGPEAPIVLLRKRADGTPLAPEVAPGNPNLGVMLPYTSLHHLLLAGFDGPVVATSGNLADEPICTDEWEAFARLGGLVDAFVVHDRPIQRHVDDSVATIVAGAPRLLRRARGYAPLPVLLPSEVPTILAVGPHLKNTVALSVGKRVFISQHIGDLETPEALQAFERVIEDFLRLYDAQPVAIAHDMHPDYLSTRWTEEAGRSGLRSAGGDAPLLVPVQHHHAHLASCLAENGWSGPALGVTWDGTGFGTDGTVWGGEFLLGDAAGYERVAHLRQFRLPGGEAAIHEPARSALALLWELYGEEALAWDDLPPVAAFDPRERRVLGQMLGRGINCPVTSAAGRLFDGIAALAGLQQSVSFEGQAAMALEFAADASERAAYPISLVKPAQNRAALPTVLDWAPLVEAVVSDVRRGTERGIIAARFHNALVESIDQVAQGAGQPAVALTGGCFQNRRLTEDTAARLAGEGFQVLLHSQVPPNDGGISLGQVAVAARQVQRASLASSRLLEVENVSRRAG